jgi:hypothetical protein
MSETIFTALDISKLDDDALFLKLTENGVQAGPIVSSTRPFYERKLAALMFGPVDSAEENKRKFSDIESEDEEDDYEEDEDDEDDQPSGVTKQVVPEASVARSVTVSPSSPNKSPNSSGLRQRMTGLRDELDSGISNYKVTEVNRQTVAMSRDGKEIRDSHHTIERTESGGDSLSAQPAKKSSLMSSLCKLLLLFLVLVVAYRLFTSEVTPSGVLPADSLMDAVNLAVPQQAEEGLQPPVEGDPVLDKASVADV